MEPEEIPEKSSGTGSNSGSNVINPLVLNEVTNRLEEVSLYTPGGNGTTDSPNASITIAPSPIGPTIPSPLTFDCLEEIIRHLIGDSPTLFSCALVNRSWCRIAVSLLWCRPFEQHIGIRKFSKIVGTYISHFSETEKQLLRIRGIRLPDIPATSKPPLFNYLRYLRGFDVSNFKRELYSWLWRSDSLRTIDSFAHVLGSLIFKHIDGLKLLRIDDPMDGFTDISTFEDLHLKLRSLESIEFYLNRMDMKNTLKKFQKFCSIISQHSYHLKQISIVYNLQDRCKEVLNSMSELVEAQHNLESITSTEFWNSNTKKFIYDILKTQSHSLRYLGVNGVANVEKLLELIKVCKELRTLEIFGFKEFDLISNGIGISSSNSNSNNRSNSSNSGDGDGGVNTTINDDGTNTLNSSYNDKPDVNSSNVTPRIHQIKLGALVCCDTFSRAFASYSPTMSIIIRMSNVHLQELILSDLTTELIECIQRQCPNLKKFCASMRHLLFPLLFPVLEGMKKLEYLYLQARHDGTNLEKREWGVRNGDTGDKYKNVREFAKSLPSTLLYLGIDFEISAGGFNVLLGEFKVGLHTLILYNYGLNEEILGSVVEYAKRVGTLRKFKHGHNWNKRALKGITNDIMEEARSVIGHIGVI